MVIGGWGRCTGLGSQRASVSRTYWPGKLETGSVSSITIASTPSSNRSKRSFNGGSAMP